MKMDSPNPNPIDDSKSQFSQNTSMFLPDISKKYKSPYNDKMFNNNKTQMMWKAMAGEELNGRTNSHLGEAGRLKYNEFDYVKRVTMAEFHNEKSLSEGRTSLAPPLQPLKEVRGRASTKRTP